MIRHTCQNTNFSSNPLFFVSISYRMTSFILFSWINFSWVDTSILRYVVLQIVETKLQKNWFIYKTTWYYRVGYDSFCPAALICEHHSKLLISVAETPITDVWPNLNQCLHRFCVPFLNQICFCWRYLRWGNCKKTGFLNNFLQIVCLSEVLTVHNTNHKVYVWKFCTRVI